MILEALRHLIIRCPPRLKHLGVLHGLIALDARARRQRKAWAPHAKACHASALDFADRATGRRLAVVAGTGLLVEIPLEELAARFDRVVCLDIFHMPTIRRRAARLANVSLIDHDVTGLMQTLPEDIAHGTLPAAVPSLPFAAEADFVLSANLASQLPLIPMEVAEARGGFAPTELTAWARAIIGGHFAVLQACPGVAGLITDTEGVRSPVGGGDPVDWWDTLEGAPLPPLADRRDWWWDLAPAPEAWRRFDVRHKVVAGVVEG